MLILDKYQNLSPASRSNAEFLISQISQLKHLFFNEIASIKNTKLEYMAFSQLFAEAFNFNETMLGKQADLDEEYKLNDEIAQQEQKIVSDKIAHDSIYQSKRGRKVVIYLMRKRPLINPANNDCVGIIILAAKLDIALQRRVMLQHFLGIDTTHSSIYPAELTEHQQQVIICLLLGFHQRKEIASILQNITDTTFNETKIKNLIQTLYQKYSCTSLHETYKSNSN